MPAPVLRLTLLGLWLGLSAVAAGCGGTREVQTRPPRPAVAAPTPAAAPDRTALTVSIAIDDAMPPHVAALRLRVGALWLKPAGEPWQKRPVDSGVVESGGPPVRLLAAEVPRRRYDSLAVVLTDPFVTFGPNAGGPLTIADSGLVRLPFPLDLSGRSAITLRLRLDPLSSLSRSGDGTWRFRPRLAVQEAPPVPDRTAREAAKRCAVLYSLPHRFMFYSSCVSTSPALPIPLDTAPSTQQPRCHGSADPLPSSRPPPAPRRL